jgi:hypothetical protein
LYTPHKLAPTIGRTWVRKVWFNNFTAVHKILYASRGAFV